MPETEHAVSAGVIHDRPFEGDDPGAVTGQRHVRIDRVIRVKIDETILDLVDLALLIHRQQFGLVVQKIAKQGMRFLHDLFQAVVAFGKPGKNLIGQPGRQCRSAVVSHFIQQFKNGHRALLIMPFETSPVPFWWSADSAPRISQSARGLEPHSGPGMTAEGPLDVFTNGF